MQSFPKVLTRKNAFLPSAEIQIRALNTSCHLPNYLQEPQLVSWKTSASRLRPTTVFVDSAPLSPMHPPRISAKSTPCQ